MPITKMTKKWDSSTTTRFVQEYAKHTCLWDVNNDNYKSRMVRESAIKDIVRKMNIDGFTATDAKIKIRIIRNTYINEVKKIKDRRKRSKNSVSTGYVCSIPWFEVADRFLRKVVRKKVYPTNLIALDSETPETVTSRTIDFGQKHRQLQQHLDSVHCQYVGINQTEMSDDLFINSPKLAGPSRIFAYDSVGRSSSELPDVAISDFMDEEEQNRIGVNDVLVSSSDEPATIEMERNYAGSVRLHRSNEPNEFDEFAKHMATHLKRLPLENALRVQNAMHQLLINERLAVIRQNKEKGLIIEHNDYEAFVNRVDERSIKIEND